MFLYHKFDQNCLLSWFYHVAVTSQPRWLSGLMRRRVHSLWLLVDHCVLRNWDQILVRAVKGLISRAGMVSICPLLWQRDVKLQQTTTLLLLSQYSLHIILISIWHLTNVPIWHCIYVTYWRYKDVTKWHCNNVTKWRCCNVWIKRLKNFHIQPKTEVVMTSWSDVCATLSQLHVPAGQCFTISQHIISSHNLAF